LTYMQKRSYTRSGQAALLIVLVSVVVLTLGLASVAQTSLDVQQSGKSEESAAAFAAAEAGVELALVSGSSGVWTDPSGLATVTYDIKPIPDIPSQASFNAGSVVAGDIFTIWLVDDPNNPLTATTYTGDVAFEWQPPTAEVEFITYYYDGSDVKVARWLETTYNSLTMNSAIAPLNNDWIMIRIRPIVEDLTSLTVKDYNTSTFPSQGTVIDSQGETTGGIARRVNVVRYHEKIPSIFDYVMYSGSGISK